MGLSKEQLDLQKEFKNQADEYVRQCEEMPKNILATWHELVGYLRDCYYMDETWDGQELKFCSNGTELFKATLAIDGVRASFINESNELKSVLLTKPEAVDDVIQMLDKTKLPERILPTDIISTNGGLCNVCLFNEKNIEIQDRRAEMTLGFNKCYGDDCDYSHQPCCGKDCPVITDIGHGTPGLTAEEVTHLMFPWWWAKSRLNPKNILREEK
jgi:hypothetical protein